MQEEMTASVQTLKPIGGPRCISGVTGGFLVMTNVRDDRRWSCLASLLAILLSIFLLSESVTAKATDRWQTLTDAGGTAREQARYKDAEQFFLMADQEAQGFGSNDGRRGSSLNNPPIRLLGSVLGNWALLVHERGLLEEAKFRYERALVIQHQTPGGDHPMIATLRDHYSGLLRALASESHRGALPQGPRPVAPVGANALAQAVDIENTQ